MKKNLSYFYFQCISLIDFEPVTCNVFSAVPFESPTIIMGDSNASEFENRG